MVKGATSLIAFHNLMKNRDDAVAHDAEFFEKHFPKELLSDVLEKFTIEWHIKKKRTTSEVKKIKFFYRAGFSVAVEFPLGFRRDFESGLMFNNSGATANRFMEWMNKLSRELNPESHLESVKQPS